MYVCVCGVYTHTCTCTSCFSLSLPPTPLPPSPQLEEKQQSLSSIEAQMRESQRGHGDVMKEKDSAIKSLQDQVHMTTLVTTTMILHVLVRVLVFGV